MQVLVTAVILLFVSVITCLIFLAMLKLHLLVSVSQRGNLRRVDIPRWYHDLDQPLWAEWLRQLVRWHPNQPLDLLPQGVPMPGMYNASVELPISEYSASNVPATVVFALPPQLSPASSAAEPRPLDPRVPFRPQLQPPKPSAAVELTPLSRSPDATAEPTRAKHPSGSGREGENGQSDPDRLQLSLPAKALNKKARLAIASQADGAAHAAATDVPLTAVHSPSSAAVRVQLKRATVGLDMPSPIAEALAEGPCSASSSCTPRGDVSLSVADVGNELVATQCNVAQHSTSTSVAIQCNVAPHSMGARAADLDAHPNSAPPMDDDSSC